LRLLGDPNRLRLLLLLHRIGDLPVFELAARSDMRPSAVSDAMRLLRAHEVVGSRLRGEESSTSCPPPTWLRSWTGLTP